MALILYGGFPLKEAITRLRAVKIMLYAHDNLALTQNRRVRIQKILTFKTSSKLKFIFGNIAKEK